MDVYMSSCRCLSSGYAPIDYQSVEWTDWHERWVASLRKHHVRCCEERDRLNRNGHMFRECIQPEDGRCIHVQS